MVTGKVETTSYWLPVTASSTYRLLPLSIGVLSNPAVSNYLLATPRQVAGHVGDHVTTGGQYFPVKTSTSPHLPPVEQWQSYELLWNCRHREYVDKQKRESAMHRLMTDIQEQDKNVSKLRNLNQVVKVRMTRLTWYTLADSFLRVVALTRSSKSNLAKQTDCDNTTVQDVIEETLVEVEETDNTQIESQLDENTDQSVEKTTFVPPHNIKKRRVSKLAKVEQSIAKLQKIAENRPKSTASASKKQDEYDAFAQHMAT
ncbi:hypothetical protein J6590_065658 [Homalodisca vitripennis]|nr:hypothetical protein J6590_065658 [Homalodisca vitripennis]